MPTVSASAIRCSAILGATALAVLSCQSTQRSFAQGTGGSSTGTGGASVSSSASSSASSSTSASSSSSQGSGGTGTGGSGTGGSVTCTAPMTTCEGACVDLGTAQTDCGSCGHDCGGGKCVGGACLPTVVYTAAAPIGTIAVSANVATPEVFFSVGDSTSSTYKLLACPVTGCGSTMPRQLVSMTYSIDAIAWVYDSTMPTVVFLSAPPQNTERPALFPCPAAGCSGTPTSVIADGLGGFTFSLPVVSNFVYYKSQNIGLGRLACMMGGCSQSGQLGVRSVDVFAPGSQYEHFIDSYNTTTTPPHNGYLLRCDPAGASPCTPATVVMQNLSGAIAMQEQSGSLYWMMQGQPGTQNGYIETCSLPGCNMQTSLVKGLYTPSAMLVDGDGAYWITMTPSIQRCKGLSCVGGAQDWVTSPQSTVGSPHDLRSDSKFVYWADGNTIYRIAK